MFERFTERARRVVVLAQDEAMMLSHNYIGTEHILLGLIHEHDGVAARVIEAAGISLATARTEVETIIGRGGEAPSGHIPFTPRAKKVLELSLREALELKKSYIGTEHLLLGLIREGHGVGAQILERLGPGASALRQQVIEQARITPPDPIYGGQDEAEDAGFWSWPAAAARGPMIRVQPAAITELRDLLASIDRRLASVDGRLASIDRRLAGIERRLGISGEEPAEPEESAQ
jgi:ATP-dependent Clp protease ATP-binding subunit ClpA